MIRNEKQLRVAQRKLRELTEALSAESEEPTRGHSEIADLVHSGADSIVSQLAREIADYADLVSNPPERIGYGCLAELPKALIAARIASGLTQADLAERVGIHENQIQRYEATDYQQASLARLRAIEAAMPIIRCAADWDLAAEADLQGRQVAQ